MKADLVINGLDFLVPSGTRLQGKSFCQVEFGRLNSAFILLDLGERYYLSTGTNHPEAAGPKCSRAFVCLLCIQSALISHHALWDPVSKNSDCELHTSA